MRVSPAIALIVTTQACRQHAQEACCVPPTVRHRHEEAVTRPWGRTFPRTDRPCTPESGTFWRNGLSSDSSSPLRHSERSVQRKVTGSQWDPPAGISHVSLGRNMGKKLLVTSSEQITLESCRECTSRHTSGLPPCHLITQPHRPVSCWHLPSPNGPAAPCGRSVFLQSPMGHIVLSPQGCRSEVSVKSSPAPWLELSIPTPGLPQPCTYIFIETSSLNAAV